MIENKKVITWSLLVLFLSLSIVYSLTYQKKESLFKSLIRNGNEITNQTGIKNQNSSFDYNKDTENNYANKTESSVSLGEIQPSGTNNQDNVTKSSASVNLGSLKTGILPGTSEYFGTLDIINVLGEKPKYTLQDSKGNYFAFYGDHLNFIDTVETLGGNVYEMKTESEILQNQLFGDRVSYINLSMFKDVRVIMVIKIDGDVRLLQIPSDKYHSSKDYLKSLFIH